jgi:hypothetical protein
MMSSSCRDKQQQQAQLAATAAVHSACTAVTEAAEAAQRPEQQWQQVTLTAEASRQRTTPAHPACVLLGSLVWWKGVWSRDMTG